MIAYRIAGVPFALELVRRGRKSRRWRLRARLIAGDPRAAREIEARLARDPEVEAVKADARSGRILVIARERPAAFREVERSAGPVAVAAPATPWHALPPDEVITRLAVDSGGLDPAEVRRRHRRYGANALEAIEERSRLRALAQQLSTLPSLLLLGSAGLSLLIGQIVDASAILTVVGLDSAIGFAVERTSERLLRSWQRAAHGEVQVVRGGQLALVAADELVPGDILYLDRGDVVPADARVIEAHRLSCDEAALTGESEPQTKSPKAVAERTALGDRSSMLFSGTSVAGGRGRAVVVATGGSTELARVRQLIGETRAPQAPLARRLERLSRQIARLSVAGAAVAAAANGLHRRPLVAVVRSGVALGVAALPEGLPVVSTAALVRAMSRMRRRGIVVRRLSSAETLGGVTVVCTDKTGTLTENRMRVEVVDGPAELLEAALLNSDVDLSRGQVLGSSTERAIVEAARAAGLDVEKLRREYRTVRLDERTDEHHYVTSRHRGPDDEIEFVKGAPEQLVELCDGLDREAVLARNQELARNGLRVLAVGCRRPGEARFTYLGLLGLRDQLRAGAAAAVADAARAGIRTVILTGDQKPTAEAIARELGIAGEVVDGDELPRRLAEGALERISVVSRVTPADKLAVVQALRDAGEIVAMAGDGVNDAPALKVADVGVAVGASSTDLARQVADVVIAGEDLRALLAAVAEGRVVQDNLRRAVKFLFATNFSELVLVVAAAILGVRDPLTPLQLLWINLLTDTLPALALALEPGHDSVLERPPAPPSAPILPRPMIRRVVRDGGRMALAAAAGSLLHPSLGFGVLTGAQIGYTLHCRAPGSVPTARFRGLFGGTMLLQLAGLATRPLVRILKIGSPALAFAGFAAGVAVPFFLDRAGDEIVACGRKRPHPQP